MKKPKVYIDTSILISPIVDKSSKAKEVGSRLGHISNRYTIVIPQIVIGESISIIIKKTGNRNLDPFQSFISNIFNYVVDYENQLPALNEEILNHALELIKLQADYLDMCDCLIIAHAIVDKEARYLLTSDKHILENGYIIQYVKQYRESSNAQCLTITDSLK
ncbi:MAG: PIN domain-containing protein [Candidatus Nitrosocaldaceae archaeon]